MAELPDDVWLVPKFSVKADRISEPTDEGVLNLEGLIVEMVPYEIGTKAAALADPAEIPRAYFKFFLSKEVAQEFANRVAQAVQQM